MITEMRLKRIPWRTVVGFVAGGAGDDWRGTAGDRCAAFSERKLPRRSRSIATDRSPVVSFGSPIAFPLV